jgi:hypothetical protein
MSFGDVRAAVHAYLSQPIKQPDTIVAALKTCHDVAPEDALHYVTSQMGWCPASTWTHKVKGKTRKVGLFDTEEPDTYAAAALIGGKAHRLGYYTHMDAREATVKIGELMLKAYYPADHQRDDHSVWPVLCSVLETWVILQRRRPDHLMETMDSLTRTTYRLDVGNVGHTILRALGTQGFISWHLVRLEMEVNGSGGFEGSILDSPHYAKFQTMIGRVMLGGPVMLRPFVLGGGLL